MSNQQVPPDLQQARDEYHKSKQRLQQLGILERDDQHIPDNVIKLFKGDTNGQA